jgi:UDP-glucose 4-epimerase
MGVLVTGGAGFIGSHLVDHLLTLGEKVTVLDDGSTGSFENLSHHNNNSDLKIVNGSIIDSKKISNIFMDIDSCFHTAAALGVENIVKNPIQALQVNLVGSENIFNLAAKAGVRTLFTSTSEIYGRTPNQPLREDSDRVLGSPSVSRWTYSEAKALDEFLALNLNKTQNFPVTIARLFNTVGPRQIGSYGMVLPKFVFAALSNQPILIHGDGSQTRTFISVDEVVKALYQLIKSNQTIGEVYNVGGTEEISIKNLAKKIIEITNSKSEITYIKHADVFGENFEEPLRRVPDITKIRQAIDWNPVKGIDQVILDIASSIGKNGF